MNICVLLVPYDSGRRGERMGAGPGQLLNRVIAPLAEQLGHRLRIEEILLDEPFTAEIRSAFRLCAMVSDRVRRARAEGCFPIVLSGNCITAVGTISGCADPNVLWFDAHGEATTPDTTTSGFLDGMGISVLTGQCWKTLARSIPGFAPLPGDRISLIGARDLEAPERELLDRLAVQRKITARENLYVHLDLDVLDSSEGVANQWSPPGGLRVSEIQESVTGLGVKAVGIASYDPSIDADGRAASAAGTILKAILNGIR